MEIRQKDLVDVVAIKDIKNVVESYLTYQIMSHKAILMIYKIIEEWENGMW